MVWRLLQQVCWVAALRGPHSPDLQSICPSVGLSSPALFSSPSLCYHEQVWGSTALQLSSFGQDPHFSEL